MLLLRQHDGVKSRLLSDRNGHVSEHHQSAVAAESRALLPGDEAVTNGKRTRDIDTAVALLEKHADALDIPDSTDDGPHSVVRVELNVS